MKTKPYLKLLVLILSALMVFLFTACDNNDEEVETTYNYSFTVDSVDYTYELTICTNSANAELKLKKNSIEVYEFEELLFNNESNTIECLGSTFSMTLNLKSNNTFEVTNINGEMHNLILGYEFYAGEYTANSGTSTVDITLNSDGTCVANEDEMTYMPWNGNKILLIDSNSSAICDVDFEDNFITVEGIASTNIEYIFDSTIYDLDEDSPIQDNSSNTKLYLSSDSNKAYFKLNKELNEQSIYYIYFGTYEKTLREVTLSYEDNSFHFVIEDNVFDYFYEETFVNDYWIRIYEDIDKAIYVGAEGRATYDLEDSSEDYYLLSSYSDDITPIEITRVVNADNLELMSIYFGDFQGLSTNSYTDSDNSEIIIADNDIAYFNNAGDTLDGTQAKIYYANNYTRESYNPNAISIENNYIMYYLDGDVFYFYSQPSFEQLNQIAPFPSQVYYGKNISYADSEFYLASLVLSTNGQASIIIYDLLNGLISCSFVVTGEYSVNGNIYAIPSGHSTHYVTLTDEVITDISEIS